MEKAQQYVVPQFKTVPGLRPQLTQGPPFSVINENNPYWAGYDDVNSDNYTHYPGLYWTDAHAQWNVPSVGTSPSGRVLSWTGLGGDVPTSSPDCDAQSVFGNTNDLCIIQAGVASATGNPAQYYFWWENFPANFLTPDTSIPVAGGDQVYVDVSYSGNNHSSFFLEDGSNGQYHGFSEPTPDVSLTSTDFIAEEGYGTGFTHFSPVTFSGCTASGQYNGGGIGGAFEAFNFRKITLVNGGTTYATPSWVNSSTDGFSVSSNI